MNVLQRGVSNLARWISQRHSNAYGERMTETHEQQSHPYYFANSSLI